jgi:orotate phosphoribosyltransferase
MAHHLQVEDPRHATLMQRLYAAGSIDLRTGEEEYVTRSGRRATWALDLRRPLLRSELLQPAAAALADRLAACCDPLAPLPQVAGRGMGAAPLVCGMIALGRGIDGLLLREMPKDHGFLRPFEGQADPSRPVWMVDDLINGANSVGKLAQVLREQGLQVAGALCLFHYAWGPGRRRLERLGLRLEPLAEVRKRSSSTSRLVLAHNPLLD